MADQEQLNLLKQGVGTWNRWRREHPTSVPDLSEADLKGAVLRHTELLGANLSNADLTGDTIGWANFADSDLRGAKLSQTIMIEVNLSGADLSGAILRGATLARTDLRGAILKSTDMREAILRVTDLRGAVLLEVDLMQASIRNVVFGDVDLSGVKGLETVNHEGPSTIGVETIYRSRGRIPEVFLRGVGLPNDFIAYIHSPTPDSITYYSCFISYSSKDEAFAKLLYRDLQNNGVRCWFAPEDLNVWCELR